MQKPYNPGIKPRVYKDPADIEKLNEKIDRAAAERRKRLAEIEQQKAMQNQNWDALASI